MPKIGSLGIAELLIILVVVLLIFGPRRLPEMAKGLGQSVREFRRGLRDMRKDIDDEGADDKAQAAGVSTAATAEGEKAQKRAPSTADDA
jgi:sec-independent protein translocase protein TatA